MPLRLRPEWEVALAGGGTWPSESVAPITVESNFASLDDGKAEGDGAVKGGGGGDVKDGPQSGTGPSQFVAVAAVTAASIKPFDGLLPKSLRVPSSIVDASNSSTWETSGGWGWLDLKSAS